MRLILVRHPQPLVAPGICYGSTDLAVTGHETARVLAALSATLPTDAALFSSPLRRCAGLARKLACTSLTFDARLVEMNFGRWEMRKWDDIARAEIDAWTNDVASYQPGGGESVLQMAERVAAFYRDIRQLRHNCAIVVCHAGTIRLLAACHAGLSPTDMALHAARTPHQIGYGEALVLHD